MTETTARVGILAAMDRELEAVLEDVVGARHHRVLGRTFHRGVLHGQDAVAVISGIGKTAVATATTLLVAHFGVRCVVLIGVAGRLDERLAIGDVVIATHLLHHDLDASPIVPRYHVPTLGAARLPADPAVSDLAHAATADFLAADGGAATVSRGLVLSGDQFLEPEAIAELRARFPDALAVEMEGAAVAQVCIEAGVPYAVVRSISDDGDGAAFQRFLETHAGRYARGIVSGLVGSLP